MHCNSIYLRTDVTAVSIDRSGRILAGIGSSIYIFSKKNELLKKLHCLNGQKIYGIVVNSTEENYLIFGGKQFTIVNYCSEEQSWQQFSRILEPVVCEDWLHSAIWRPQEDQILFLTAHNVVLSYNIKTLTCTRLAGVDNSILYSGLLVPLDKQVLVLAGTVYSEVIVQLWGKEKPLQCLKGHKGVIFSISCHPEMSTIVTTSDDRSVRIWGPKLPLQWNNISLWRSEFICKYVIYGHQARVMRSIINNTQIISVGEDSHICFWSFEGVLLKRVRRHQSAGIWSVAANDCVLVTGGGDGAVVTQDISYNDISVTHTFTLDSGKPKHIAYSAKGNFFILLENNLFVYYDNEKNQAISTKKLLEQNVTAYHSVSISPCRKICAIAGRKANLLLAIEDDGAVRFEEITLENDTVLSIHWASDETLVACSENGLISIINISDTGIEAKAIFELPICKERWLTAAVNDSKGNFILGDRCGGVHLFKISSKHPIKTYYKLHGRYGPTSFTISNDKLITTGRDRMIQYFRITENDLVNVGAVELDFHWVERFLDLNERLVCGFKEKLFVVHNLRQNEVLLEIACGGGHRSYDVLHSNNNNTLKLAFVKNSSIHTNTIELKKHTVNTLISGSHSKEINCLKTLLVDGKTIFVSGSEDTTIRLSFLDENNFEDILFYKQLSSIRTLKICKNRDGYLLISGGGRAQISVKSIKFKTTQNGNIELDTQKLVDFMLKGTDRQRKGERNWKSVTVDIDPETRIMDIDYIKRNDSYTIFAGCSDGCLRIFNFHPEKSFDLIKETWLPHCILKTSCVKYKNQDWLITCTTRGEVAFWNTSNILSDNFEPRFVMQTNKSGINCIAVTIKEDTMLIATGGDDNSVHLTVLQPSQDNLNSMQVIHSVVLDSQHSSAITGLCLVGNYLLSTSIDQRITVIEWKVADNIECRSVYQAFSDVADVKGMDVITCDSSTITVCVYGKGLEVFKIRLPSS